MDLSKLAVLKEKLRTARQFREIVDYFLDEIAAAPGFMDQGERVAHPFLEAVVTQVGSQCFSDNVRVFGLLLTRIPDYKFIHGGCMVNGHPGTMIFFEDLQMGLFTLAIAGKETKFARFSTKPYPQGIVPSTN
jgi:hypothetical protein